MAPPMQQPKSRSQDHLLSSTPLRKVPSTEAQKNPYPSQWSPPQGASQPAEPREPWWRRYERESHRCKPATLVACSPSRESLKNSQTSQATVLKERPRPGDALWHKERLGILQRQHARAVAMFPTWNRSSVGSSGSHCPAAMPGPVLQTRRSDTWGAEPSLPHDTYLLATRSPGESPSSRLTSRPYVPPYLRARRDNSGRERGNVSSNGSKPTTLAAPSEVPAICPSPQLLTSTTKNALSLGRHDNSWKEQYNIVFRSSKPATSVTLRRTRARSGSPAKAVAGKREGSWVRSDLHSLQDSSLLLPVPPWPPPSHSSSPWPIPPEPPPFDYQYPLFRGAATLRQPCNLGACREQPRSHGVGSALRGCTSLHGPGPHIQIRLVNPPPRCSVAPVLCPRASLTRVAHVQGDIATSAPPGSVALSLWYPDEPSCTLTCPCHWRAKSRVHASYPESCAAALEQPRKLADREVVEHPFELHAIAQLGSQSYCSRASVRAPGGCMRPPSIHMTIHLWPCPSRYYLPDMCCSFLSCMYAQTLWVAFPTRAKVSDSRSDSVDNQRTSEGLPSFHVRACSLVNRPSTRALQCVTSFSVNSGAIERLSGLHFALRPVPLLVPLRPNSVCAQITEILGLPRRCVHALSQSLNCRGMSESRSLHQLIREEPQSEERLSGQHLVLLVTEPSNSKMKSSSFNFTNMYSAQDCAEDNEIEEPALSLSTPHPCMHRAARGCCVAKRRLPQRRCAEVKPRQCSHHTTDRCTGQRAHDAEQHLNARTIRGAPLHAGRVQPRCKLGARHELTSYNKPAASAVAAQPEENVRNKRV
ncbi:hypothetical protein GGX14DRAFT_559485 [Mycena pura]|uniref:Uncharacterized protein n=1 Tax=Mycena pura TaxID=153505 RepID=A0AAD6YGT8_9AGAR|nr:hypothetical protein GGX14DRAFT_559485 [Mycena pura]